MEYGCLRIRGGFGGESKQKESKKKRGFGSLFFILFQVGWQHLLSGESLPSAL